MKAPQAWFASLGASGQGALLGNAINSSPIPLLPGVLGCPRDLLGLVTASNTESSCCTREAVRGAGMALERIDKLGSVFTDNNQSVMQDTRSSISIAGIVTVR